MTLDELRRAAPAADYKARVTGDALRVTSVLTPMNDLRLYRFECGILRCKVHNIKMNQGLGEPYAISVPWFLIQHPRGTRQATNRSWCACPRAG
jgi:hypothetical protein